MSWIPDTYHTYRRERELAIADLLAHVHIADPSLIVDLGCGAGTSTTWIARRFPRARMIGVDSSDALIERARLRPITAEWTLSDLAKYTPPVGVDLIISNSALQWVNNHADLLQRLMKALPQGGVLAIQAPSSHGDPCYAALQRVIQRGPWARAFESIDVTKSPVLAPEDYYTALAQLSDRVSLWRTQYVHALHGPAPVLEWLRGSTLGPLLGRLDADAAKAFLDEFAAELDQIYPRGTDGTTLFPFHRTFVVAERG